MEVMEHECQECGVLLQYYEWPCIEPETGAVLGVICLWECPECGWIYDDEETEDETEDSL